MTERISACASGPSGASSSTSSISAAIIPIARDKIDEASTLHALDQHANGTVGKLQKLHRRRDHAEIVHRIAIGIVFSRIELGDEEQLLVGGPLQPRARPRISRGRRRGGQSVEGIRRCREGEGWGENKSWIDIWAAPPTHATKARNIGPINSRCALID